MQPAALPLPRILDRLAKRHGAPKRPRPRTALDWILWENAAYLVPDERRAEAFDALRERTGLRAERILALPPHELLSLAALGGMQPQARVEKLCSIAETVRDAFDGDLESALSLALPKARAALKRFPGIGTPGADKILLFTGTHPLPALDSNGVRTLVRLGLAQEAKGYAATYRSAIAALAPHASKGCAWLMRAHDLLRTHGQTLCKRNEPLCEECPLADVCPSAT